MKGKKSKLRAGSELHRLVLIILLGLLTFVLPTVALLELGRGRFLSPWLFVAWPAAMLIAGWNAFKVGLRPYPIWPGKAWFRRLNAMLFRNSLKVGVGAVLASTMLLLAAMSAIQRGFDAATAFFLWLVSVYLLFCTYGWSRQIHQHGFTFTRSKGDACMVELHLSARSKSETIALFSMLKGNFLCNALEQLRWVGASHVKVVSPTRSLVKRARSIFSELNGEAAVVDFAPEPLPALHSWLFRRLLSHVADVTPPKKGRLLQTGFIARI